MFHAWQEKLERKALPEIFHETHPAVLSPKYLQAGNGLFFFFLPRKHERVASSQAVCCKFHVRANRMPFSFLISDAKAVGAHRATLCCDRSTGKLVWWLFRSCFFLSEYRFVEFPTAGHVWIHLIDRPLLFLISFCPSLGAERDYDRRHLFMTLAVRLDSYCAHL